MCGIVGLISRRQSGFTHSNLDLMQNLLLLDTLRGEDSTGVYSIMRNSNVTTLKVGSHPMHLFETEAWSKLRQKTINQGRMMIGHNRKATMGSVNSTNAHPFHENNIVLVHNGTLRGGHKQLADTEVDSHAVCHAFAEKGAEEVLKTLDAAFAFVWWDINKNKLYAVRNTERPLSIVLTDDLVILASESWMPEACIRRTHGKIENVIHIEPGVLYEFSMDGSFTTSKVALKPEPVYANQYGHWPPSGRVRNASRHWTDDDDSLVEDATNVKMIGTSGNAPSSNGTVTPPTNSSTCTQTPIDLTRTVIAAALQNATAHYTNPHYSKGEDVLIKLTEATADGVLTEGKIRVTGKIIEPGKPIIDVVGYLEGDADKEYIKQLMQGEAIGNIVGFAKSSFEPSAWVRNIEKASVVKVHNTDVSQKVWTYVVKNVHCKDCGNGIHDVEAAFTSVSKARNTEYRVTCADCIEFKLPEGENRNVFTQRRLDALQDRKSVSSEPPRGTLSLVKTKGQPTVH